MDKAYVVNLTSKERQRLLAVVNKGQNKAAVIRRAHILLKSDEGKTDREISELLYIHENSVRNTRKRFVEDGLRAALEDQAKPHREPKLNEQQQAQDTKKTIEKWKEKLELDLKKREEDQKKAKQVSMAAKRR